jgi:hypothetical protein
MGIIRLTEREQLIKYILRMPDEQIAVLAEIAEDLEEDLDPAMIETRRNEPTITLDDYLRESSLTRQSVEAAARVEGWLSGIIDRR